MLTMSLRVHLDRYCESRAVMNNLPRRDRSRSPQSGVPQSPFFAPPGWIPPRPRDQRPIIVRIDLQPLRRLVDVDEYYSILNPNVAANLVPPDRTALFSTFKVIWPNYASRFYMWHLYDLVISTFESRWTLRLDIDTFRLFVQHPEHKRMLNNMNATILSVLTNLNPQWQDYQHMETALMAHPNTGTDRDSVAVVLHLAAELIWGSCHMRGKKHETVVIIC